MTPPPPSSYRLDLTTRPDGPGGPPGDARRLSLLLAFALLSFSANSLITRHVVAARLFDPGLLSGVRVLSGAVALAGVALARHERVVLDRGNLVPTVALGVYAGCISYGYRFIGAAAGTFVFYATVMLTLVVSDLLAGTPLSARRRWGAALSLLGILVLTVGRAQSVTPLGVVLLAATGAAWGVYTRAGRGAGDPRVVTTGTFVLLAVVLTPFTAAGLISGLRVSWAGAGWAVLMGAVTTAFAYVAWYACQRSLTGTAAGSAQSLVPVLTAIGAVLLLGERLTWTMLVAAVLVAAGLWLNRPRPASEAAAAQ